MPRRCHIDIETFSQSNLKKAGVYRYAEDPSTEILCIAYAFDDEPVNLWVPPVIPDELESQIQEYMDEHGGIYYTSYFGPPVQLVLHANNGGAFVAFNANFERTILNSPVGKSIGFPSTKLTQWYCAAAKAAIANLPRDLSGCARALETEHLKDEDGHRIMLRLSKPRKPSKHNPATRWLPEDVPDSFLKLYTYCIDDVLTERAIDHRLIDLSPRERRTYLLDQTINDRGWMIDKAAVRDVKKLIKLYKLRLNQKCMSTTGFSATQTMKIKQWVIDQGFEISDLQAKTIKSVCSGNKTPSKIKWVLRIFSLYNMKAVTKFDAMLEAVCQDGCLRGMFKYYGASTGRWSSLIVQLQNLFRPVIDDPEFAIGLFREHDLKVITNHYNQNPMQIFASCVRGMLIARPGRELIFADYSAIEARIVAWLANQEDLLDVFASHGLVYEHTAMKLFTYVGAELSEHELRHFAKQNPTFRFMGKIAVLALGFQGGHRAFINMAEDYGAKVSVEKSTQIKDHWRAANPKIVQLWYNLNDTCKKAILNKGTPFITNKLMFKVEGDWLRMRMPSTRRLSYYKPRIENDEIVYMGVDTYTRRWMKCKLYGGKLVQNAAEAIARDLMVESMMKLRKTKRYPIIGSVHDEIITEPKKGEGSPEEMCQIMTDAPDWAAGLPIRAVGERAERYKK